MADLKIPNLNIKPDKYIFKKKLNLRRKSKKRLFTESFILFILSVLLVYINYLILSDILVINMEIFQLTALTLPGEKIFISSLTQCMENGNI